jgi:hypothetical protein
MADCELQELIVTAVGKLEPEDQAAVVKHLYYLYSHEAQERRTMNSRMNSRWAEYDSPFPAGPFSF